MAEEIRTPSADENAEAAAPSTGGKVKKVKPVETRPNVFVRFFRWIKKFCKDVKGEMGKVVWTSKEDLFKSTKLVLVTVVVISAAIAVVDFVFSYAINFIAGLIG